jgi:L-arabinose isomerase
MRIEYAHGPRLMAWVMTPLPLPTIHSRSMRDGKDKAAAAAQTYESGAHRTAFSQALRIQHVEASAEIAGIEAVRIDSCG